MKDGKIDKQFPLYGYKNWSNTGKIRNKQVKTINGNRNNAINILHWNMGPMFWKRKTDNIQLLVDEKSPDVLLISESNLFLDDLDHEIKIEDYDIHMPKTMISMQYSRLIMLTRTGMQLQVMEDLMHPLVSSIWIKISGRGRKNLYIGGIYREQTLFKCPKSEDQHQQEARWKIFIDQMDQGQ